MKAANLLLQILLDSLQVLLEVNAHNLLILQNHGLQVDKTQMPMTCQWAK